MGTTNEEIAIRVFGWKWIAFHGIPTRSTPGYPSQCPVRQFFSPKTLASDIWAEWFGTHDCSEATGGEPLAYCYCSSQGPERVPNFMGQDDLLVLEAWRKKWKRRSREWASFAAALPAAEDYHLGDYSLAALAVLDLAEQPEKEQPHVP